MRTGRPRKSQPIKTYSDGFKGHAHADLVGPVENIPIPERTLPPSDSQFPPMEGGIHDPLRVMRLAYAQMIIEKLRAQQTAYRLSFDNQIKEMTTRKTTTLAQLQQELASADDNYRSLQKEIEEAHGISLQGYTFNPDSGTFNKIVDPSKKSDTEPEPAAQTQ